jgi:hypothetical protein
MGGGGDAVSMTEALFDEAERGFRLPMYTSSPREDLRRILRMLLIESLLLLFLRTLLVLLVESLLRKLLEESFLRKGVSLSFVAGVALTSLKEAL